MLDPYLNIWTWGYPNLGFQHCVGDTPILKTKQWNNKISSRWRYIGPWNHYCAGIMNAMASQIIGVSMVCSNVCSAADERKHQSSAPLAFVRGNHPWPVISPHKVPVTRKMFLFMTSSCIVNISPGNGLLPNGTKPFKQRIPPIFLKEILRIW